jgi:FAD/FMN-containing dehydrogenase
MDSRLKKPLVALGIIVALVVGVVLGISAGLADKIFGPNAKTIATSSLQAMRAENRLIAFEARYVSVVTTDKSSFGLSAERTLILPGDVRYEIDLAALSPKDLSWDSDSKTLSVKLPEIEIAGPDVDLTHAREYGSSGLLGVFTDARTQLDEANRATAVADLRQQAQAPVPMRLAREAARQDIERSFALPLAAAGFKDVKVVARFPEDGDTGPTTYMDGSTPLNEVMNGANR